MFRVLIAERQSRQHQLLGSDKRSDPNLGFGRFSILSGTCWSTAASSVLLWCLKSSPLERWRREREAEARSSRRGEECIRPLAAADCWRPERHQQPHHQQEEEEEEEEAGRKEKELEQLVMTSVWGLKPGTTYVTRCLRNGIFANRSSANGIPLQNLSW